MSSPVFRPPSASEEHTSVSAVHRTQLKENETWSVIDEKWAKQWSAYSGFDLSSGRKSDPTSATRPGEITNDKLIDKEKSGDSPIAVMKRGIMEHFEYVVVPKEVADLLYSWYGGGPRLDRSTRIQGIYRSASLNLYPPIVKIVPINEENGEPDNDKAVYRMLDDSMTLEEFKKQLSEEMKTKEQSEKAPTIRFWFENRNKAKEQSELEGTVGYKRINGVVSTAVLVSSDGEATATTEAAPETSPSPNDSKQLRVIESYVTAGDDEYSSTIGVLTMGLTTTPLVLVDRQRSEGVWSRSSPESDRDWKDFRIGDHIDAMDSVKKWYESIIEDMKDDQLLVHFIGWPSKWDEWIGKDSDRLAKKGTHSKKRDEYMSVGYSSSYSSSGYGSSSYSYGGWGNSQSGTPSPSGAVGFQNLGNTCFMNSILQSLMHCPGLVEYFRGGLYSADLNLDNPLGWKGKVAEEYASLVKQYWSDQYTSIAPRSFKTTLGEFQPRFSGYQQQDSSELLSFLLDGLHEDLNLVKKKPPTPAVESNDRPDDIVSREAWVTYLKRNQSVVVDMFQGQLKSKLICPDANCGKISITFDPYTFLSLPLPSLAECVVQVHFVPADSSKPIVLYGVTVPKISRISDLKNALGQMVGVPGANLVLADISQSKIFRIYQSDDNVGDIRSSDVTYAYECTDIEKFAKSSDYCAVQVVNQEFVKNKYWDPSWKYTSEFTLEPFGSPSVVVLPRKGLTVAALRAKVNAAVQTVAKGAEELQFEIRLLQNDMRGCYNCDLYSSTGPRCLGCVLKAKGESEDEEFDLKFDKMANEPTLGVAVVWKNRAEQYNDGRESSIQKHASADQTGSTKKAESIPLTKCLEAFAVPEVLSGEDLWFCGKCKNFQPATKQMAIWSSPQILIIHLKRFSYSRVSRDKISTLVDFPLEGLDMTPYLQSKLGQSAEPAIYDCFAVSNHMGGLMGGHYHAYIRNLTTGDWFLHNDSSVSKIHDKSEIISSSAYVIFYQLRGAANRTRNLLDGEGNLVLEQASNIPNGEDLAAAVQKMNINGESNSPA